MTRLRMIVGEAWRSITASMSTTVAATMTVLVAMLVLGTTIGLGTWVLSYSDHIKKQLLVKVYFKNSRTPQQINAVGRRFDPKANPRRREADVRLEGRGAEDHAEAPPAAGVLQGWARIQPVSGRVQDPPKNGEYINELRAQLRPMPAGVVERSTTAARPRGGC